MSASDAEVGICDLCGQELIRTEERTWHPWNVARACPPEPSVDPYDGPGWDAFHAAGKRSLEPGREHWKPVP